MLLGSAYGKVTLDASGVKAGVDQAASSLQRLQAAGEQVGSALKSAGQALTLGVTLPIVAAGGAAIKMASDLEETKSKVKVIFGDMSGDMLNWAESANTSLGQTRTQALDAASTFALFGKAAGKSGTDLNKFSQQNVGFAADFASFYNTNPEDAITAIGAAYRGETEPIRRYNILLNDQVVKQKAVELGLYSGTGALSQQARIMAVNTLITEQGSAAMGDFARTSGGLANQSRILNAQFKDSLMMLGTNLLPIALQVVKGLNAMLTVFQKLPVPVQQGIIVFAALLAALGPVLGIIGQLMTTITAISTAWPYITAAVSAAGPAFTAISAVITGTVIPAIVGFIVAALPIIAAVALVAAALFLLYAAFSTNFMGITTTVQQLGVIIPFYFNKMWKDAETAFGNGVKAVSAWMLRMRDGILAIFRVDWGMIGRNIILGIVNGIVSGIGSLIAAAKRAASAVMDTFRNTLKISSPSAVFQYYGQMSAAGYAKGMQQFDPAVIANMAARPAQQTTSQQATSYQTVNFAGGLSIKEARRMQAESEQRMKKWTMNTMGAR